MSTATDMWRVRVKLYSGKWLYWCNRPEYPEPWHGWADPATQPEMAWKPVAMLKRQAVEMAKSIFSDVPWAYGIELEPVRPVAIHSLCGALVKSVYGVREWVAVPDGHLDDGEPAYIGDGGQRFREGVLIPVSPTCGPSRDDPRRPFLPPGRDPTL